MKADLPSRHRKRSIGAVAAGFLVTALLSVTTDVAVHAIGVFPPWGEPMAAALFVWATAYRIVFTVLGGYVTATLAPGRPMWHVTVLGAIGTLAATVGAVATWNAGPAFGPKWYPILLVVTALPCVWAGGALRMRLQGAT
jgi:hypothetical protein